MFPTELTILRFAVQALRDRLDTAGRNRDAGYSTEAVLVTALLAALALTALGIITAKVIGKASNLNLD